jgi:hypothetical protein
MRPVLWGPPLWQAMFACAWGCADLDALRALLLRQLPQLLPCAECRDHWARHRSRVTRRAGGEPRDRVHAFRWLWYLKDEVNRTLERPSLPLRDLTDRYALHGGTVDDVALGDALVLVALSARRGERDDLFVEACHTLAALLPLPADSQFRLALARARRPAITAATEAARAARVERGLREQSLAHYRALAAS